MSTNEKINAQVLHRILQLYEDNPDDILLLLNATRSMKNNNFWKLLCCQYAYNNDAIMREMCESQLELRREDIAKARRIVLVKTESRLLAVIEKLLRREITMEEARRVIYMCAGVAGTLVVGAIVRKYINGPVEACINDIIERTARIFADTVIPPPDEAYLDAIADFDITQSATQEELRAAYLRKRIEIGSQRAVETHEVEEQLVNLEAQLLIILHKRRGTLLPQITNNNNDNPIESPLSLTHVSNNADTE